MKTLYAIHNVNMTIKEKKCFRGAKQLLKFVSLDKAKEFAKTLNTKKSIYTATEIKQYVSETNGESWNQDTRKKYLKGE